MSDAAHPSPVSPLTATSPPPWFLTTPPDAPDAGERPRLIALLDEAVRTSSVVVLAAPIGSGKSTAALHWTRRTKRRVAWLRLTRFDREPDRIAAGLIAALRRVTLAPSALAVLEASLDLRNPVAVAARIEEVVRGRDVTIVVDQAELAANLAESAIGVLAVHRHPGVSIMALFTGSSDLARRELGASAEPTIIGTTDLAFTAAEISALTTDAGDQPDTARAASVAELTRGWAIAVRAALSPDGSSLEDLVEQEIVPALTADEYRAVRATIVCTAIDDDVAAVLAPGAVRHLDALALESHIVERYSHGSSRRYVWRPFFRDAFLAMERRADPRALAAAHAAAGRALATSDPLMAIEQFLAAAEPAEAYTTLLANWLAIVQDGRSGGLDALVAALPVEYAERPAARAIRACCALAAGDGRGAEVHLRRAEATAPPELIAERSALVFARLLTIHDPDRLRELLAEADHLLSFPDAVPAPLLPHALLTMGYISLRVRRGPLSTVDTLRTARREAVTQGRHGLAARVAGVLSFALAFEGSLSEALEMAALSREAGSSGGWLAYDAGAVSATEGFVAYWRGEFSSARAAFADVQREHGATATAFAPLAAVYGALAAANSTDLEWQATALDELRAMPANIIIGVPWHAFRDAALAALSLARGWTADAERYADRIAAGTEFVPVPLAVACETLRRIGRGAKAHAILEATDFSRMTAPARIQLLLTDALLRAKSGRVDAHLALERALDTAEPEAIVQPFDTRDPAVAGLLGRHLGWSTRHVDFVARILADGPARTQAKLTSREAEVLTYLRTPMTVEEIGEALFLSPNTVKTHVQSLYRKLGVTRRREAIRVQV